MTDEHEMRLPEPMGYNLLCAIPEIEKEFGSGIAKADITMNHEAILTTVLCVLRMGKDCYQDVRRFPSGPWCKVHDFILVMPHAGGRIKIDGQEYRIIKDDSVLAVVDDPRGITRA